jgi:hypothetical protein
LTVVSAFPGMLTCYAEPSGLSPRSSDGALTVRDIAAAMGSPRYAPRGVNDVLPLSGFVGTALLDLNVERRGDPVAVHHLAPAWS